LSCEHGNKSGGASGLCPDCVKSLGEKLTKAFAGAGKRSEPSPNVLAEMPFQSSLKIVWDTWPDLMEHAFMMAIGYLLKEHPPDAVLLGAASREADSGLRVMRAITSRAEVERNVKRVLDEEDAKCSVDLVALVKAAQEAVK
jgi:hypothetical protein